MALEGYSSTDSVQPGHQIQFHLNNDASANFTVQVVRVSRAAPVVTTGSGHVDPQATPANAGEAGAGWDVAFTLAVPNNWASGIYRARFAAGANQTEVAFVVRPSAPASTSSILLAVTTTTEHAYNGWTGGNLYPSPGSPGAEDRNRRVSLDRPVLPPAPFQYSREQDFLLWMEDHGLSAEVCTGIDLHAGAVPLDPYTMLLSVGHDEYWSKEMRDAVEAYIAGGGNVAFFSGNVCWWQVRFEDGNRTMVCYKSALEDPLTGVDNDRVTVNWFDDPVNRPENGMTGVGFRSGAGHWTGGNNAAYTAVFPQHWVFEGTGVGQDQVFGADCVGYEADGAQLIQIGNVQVATGRDGTPADFQVIATADLGAWAQFGQPGIAVMGMYQRGGTVFTAATTDWTNGMQDPVISRVTQNVLQRLSTLPASNRWAQVGHASTVVAMCAMYWFADLGPGSGRALFAATSDDQLWRRPPVPINVTWSLLGEANSVIAMAAMDARLYAITSDGALWSRTTENGVLWDQLGDAPDGATSLAAMEGQLYVTTEGGALLRSAPDPLAWHRLGTPGSMAAMTAMGGRLIGVTADGGLRTLRPAAPAAWQDAGAGPSMVALAALDGLLYGADDAGRLWARPPIA